MAKKIEITGNALIVTDTVSSDILIEEPKKMVYYSVDSLAVGIILLQISDGSTSRRTGLIEIPLSEAVDSTDTPFTDATFRAFSRTNLGN